MNEKRDIENAVNIQARERRKANDSGSPSDDQKHANLQIFVSALEKIDSIPQNLLAVAAYESKAFARSVMHQEYYIRKKMESQNAKSLSSEFAFLQKIYPHLGESDSMDGLSSYLYQIGYSTSLEQQILENQTAGRWTTVHTCYEVVLQQSPENVDNHTGLLECLRNLGHYGNITLPNIC